ncbi:MAG: DUF1501 domain-containing protein [Chloroflexi bacterium]|nr:DUF1501 domain-containing protein [Chloroflexota bacterium]
MSISRRGFLKATGKAAVIGLGTHLFPSWMPRMAFAQGDRANRDVLVAIFQRGGMDGLNAVVPFGEGANYYDRRPTIGISAPDGSDSSAIDLDGFFGLHPALRPLKEVFDAGALTVIHGAGSPDPTRSHFDAMEYMERGIPGDKLTGTGWINRHLQSAAWQNNSPFRAIGMGSMLQGSLRGPISALALRSITDFHLAGRTDQLSTIQRTFSGLYSVQAPVDALTVQASGVFGTMEQLAALSALEYPPGYGALYPDTEFGMGLRQIAQLIKADVGLEVGCVDIGGWDTHDGQGSTDGELANRLTEFAEGLAAFYSDLRDYMANVTVVTMSEFGRTASENASAGTDHGRASAMFVMGGGVTGGMVADWRGLADDALDEGDLAVTIDYRDVLAEILTKRVSNSAIDQIFPGYTPNLRGLIRERA